MSIPNTMKRCVMAGPGHSVLEEVAVPSIGPDEILVKMRYCGVCRSEHDAWRDAQPGRLLGHEPVGTVARLGEQVQGFALGQRVSGLSYPAMAEYVVFKARHTVAVPDTISDEDAMAEPLACLVSAIQKLPLYRFAAPVGVVGCGFMGLGAVSLLRMKNAGPIIAVDVREEARAQALALGAEEAYHPDEVPQQYLATWELGFEGGLGVVTEWAENEQALDLAGRMCAIDGTLGIGSYHSGGRRQVDMQLWNYKALTAISLHERDMDRMVACYRAAYELLASGRWAFLNLPHKVYRLDQFDLAQQEILTKPGGFVKGLIDCSSWA